MSRQQIQAVIVCEDRCQEVFLRRLLVGLGFAARKVRVVPAPPAQGAGEQFVRLRYAREVRAFRQRNPAFHVLLVALDADTGTVEDHFRELATQMRTEKLADRAGAERIALVIPRRNIETWIHFLLGNPVAADEVEDFKNQYRSQPERDYCQPAVARLIEHLHGAGAAPPGCPPSLVVGIEELRRLLE